MLHDVITTSGTGVVGYGTKVVSAAEICYYSAEISKTLQSFQLDELRVIVFVQDPIVFYTSVIATFRNKCVLIPVEPSSSFNEVMAIVELCEVNVVISDTAGNWGGCRVVEVCFSKIQKFNNSGTYDRSLTLDESTILLALAFNKIERIDGRQFLEQMKKLDLGVGTLKNAALVIVECVPVAARIISLLWAYQNNLSIYFGTGEEYLQDFVPRIHGLSIDFSLFYFGGYHTNPTSLPSYKLILESVKFADRNGYAGVWTPERHFNSFGGLFPNPAVLSAGLATITTNIQLRCGSTVLPLSDSIRIAENWALVDNLSNGRVSVSFASGWQADDFVFFPEKFCDRDSHLFAQVEEVRRLWRGDTITRLNGMGKNIDLRIFPQPIQRELPFWITAAGKREIFEKAGEIGANVLTHMVWQNDKDLEMNIKAYRQSLFANGFDPSAYKVAVMIHTFVGDSTEEVREMVKKPLKEYIKSSVGLIKAMTSKIEVDGANYGRYNSSFDDSNPQLTEELLEIAFNRFFEKAGLFGSIKKVSKTVESLIEIGVDDLACLVDFGLDQEAVFSSLEYLTIVKNHYMNPVRANINRIIFQCSKRSGHALNRDIGIPQMSKPTLLRQIFEVDDTIFLELNLASQLVDDKTTTSFVQKISHDF